MNTTMDEDASLAEQQNIEVEEKLTCRRCGYETSCKSNLVRHLRRQSVCQATRSNIHVSEYLNELLKREYNDKTYDCDICHRRFNSRSNKSRHRKTCSLSVVLVDQGNSQPSSPQSIDEPDAYPMSTTATSKDSELIAELQKHNIALTERLEQVEQRLHSLSSGTCNTSAASSSSDHTNPTPIKKNKIHHTIRIKVWNKHIGVEVGRALCLCCKKNHITQHQFICGHVVSHAQGGEIDIDNLRPICSTCNRDMGCTDMRIFASSVHNVTI